MVACLRAEWAAWVVWAEWITNSDRRDALRRVQDMREHVSLQQINRSRVSKEARLFCFQSFAGPLTCKAPGKCNRLILAQSLLVPSLNMVRAEEAFSCLREWGPEEEEE